MQRGQKGLVTTKVFAIIDMTKKPHSIREAVFAMNSAVDKNHEVSEPSSLASFCIIARVSGGFGPVSNQDTVSIALNVGRYMVVVMLLCHLLYCPMNPEVAYNCSRRIESVGYHSSYNPALNFILQLKFVCLTNHTFTVFQSASGCASSKSKLRTSCGISLVISRRLIFLPMQVLDPIPNYIRVSELFLETDEVLSQQRSICPWH
jgi:hypothetical protein